MSDRPVAVDADTEAVNEDLPYPIVKYPSHYGTFIGFKQDQDGDLFFCTCAKEAIENYIRCEVEGLTGGHQDPTPENIVNGEFPEETKTVLQKAGVEEPSQIVNTVSFAEQLCHECNVVVPKYRYCADMYGTVFRQNYGWYIYKKFYEYGVCKPKSDTLLADTLFDSLPSDLVDVVEDDLIAELEVKAERFNELKEKRRGRGTEVGGPVRDEIEQRVEAIRNKYDESNRLSPELAAEYNELQEELSDVPLSEVLFGDKELSDDVREKMERREELSGKLQQADAAIEKAKMQEIKSVLAEYDDYTWIDQHGGFGVAHEDYKERGELPPGEESEYEVLREELSENSKAVSDTVGNEVRQAVGHYEKGNRWTSETILYQLVESRYGDEYTIKRHHRPDWLDGLELDIYIVEADVGVEYQGVQHYESVEHWSGEEALEERQQRDRRTKELCRERGVDVVEIRFDEELSKELIRRKIDPLT